MRESVIIPGLQMRKLRLDRRHPFFAVTPLNGAQGPGLVLCDSCGRALPPRHAGTQTFPADLLVHNLPSRSEMIKGNQNSDAASTVTHCLCLKMSTVPLCEVKGTWCYKVRCKGNVFHPSRPLPWTLMLAGIQNLSIKRIPSLLVAYRKKEVHRTGD